MVWSNRGNIHEAREEYEAARSDYERAIAADPRFARAWANRALVRRKLGDVPGAIADYERALELYPPDAPQVASIRRDLAGLRSFQAR